MSTKLTEKQTAMVDSDSLQLVFAAAKLHESITHYLATCLSQQGYSSITPTVLSFLGAMDCGVNYGAEIARNLNISRQMVAKTVKELSVAGYLQQLDGVGKQKQIVFTQKGEALIAQARQLLAKLDQQFSDKLGQKKLRQLNTDLNNIMFIMRPADD